MKVMEPRKGLMALSDNALNDTQLTVLYVVYSLGISLLVSFVLTQFFSFPFPFLWLFVILFLLLTAVFVAILSVYQRVRLEIDSVTQTLLYEQKTLLRKSAVRLRFRDVKEFLIDNWYLVYRRGGREPMQRFVLTYGDGQEISFGSVSLHMGNGLYTLGKKISGLLNIPLKEKTEKGEVTVIFDPKTNLDHVVERVETAHHNRKRMYILTAVVILLVIAYQILKLYFNQK